MTSISLAEAKGRLSELVDRVQAGDEVTITRRGKDVAVLKAAARSRQKIDLAKLQAVTRSLPRRDGGATDFVRKMRDDDRY